MIWLLSACCGGCLVTDQIMFPADTDIPPTILDVPGTSTPIGRIIWINKSATSEWSLPVRVRDDNVTQTLEAHWRLVSKGNMSPPFSWSPLSPQGQLIRDLNVRVESGFLQQGECHRVELAVSGDFFSQKSPAFFDAVPDKKEDGVAYASWWIWEGQGDALVTAEQKARLVDSCNAIEALLMPNTAKVGP